jgi:hypothetical protein
VCRFHIAAGAKQSLDEVPYKLSGAIAKLAGITFLSLAFSYWTDKPWFLTEGKLLLYSSYLPLGVPNRTVIYINTATTRTIFWRHCHGLKKKKKLRHQLHFPTLTTCQQQFSGAVVGEKEDFCKGSLPRTSFTLFIVLLYFIFTCIILSKTQKN